MHLHQHIQCISDRRTTKAIKKVSCLYIMYDSELAEGAFANRSFLWTQIATIQLGRHRKSCRTVRIAALPRLPGSQDSEFVDRALIV
jgi:hypothetical protein